MTQQVIGIWGSIGSVSERRVRTLDPTTWTWGAQVTIDATAPAAWRWEDVALATLPDERVIAMCCGDDGTVAATAQWWRVYYSDDAGATWALYADRPFLTISAYLGTTSVSLVSSARSRVLVTRDGDALSLPSGELHTTFANVLAVSVGQLRDEFVSVRELGCVDHMSERELSLPNLVLEAVQDVLEDRSSKQRGFLRHERYRAVSVRRRQ
jgi:hypothetical protein